MFTRPASRLGVRLLTRSFHQYARPLIQRSNFQWKTVSLLTLVGGGVYLNNSIKLDDSANEDSVAVDKSIDPFPLGLRNKTNLHEDYLLLGHGVRSVTFLGFKVYGIGIYLAEKDLVKVKKLLAPEWLSTFGTENHSLKELLEDPNTSQDIIERLIDNGIRFTVRISPVRNTDFGHLRDGLVKSILAHTKAKELKEPISEGLSELRQVFQGFKGSVPKNHLLWLEFENGNLNVSYENPAKKVIKEMGSVKNPLIGKTLMLQYLSGAKPLLEPLRKSCIEGLDRL